MKDSSNFSFAERQESLKAGVLTALSAFLAFACFTLGNQFILVPQFEPLTELAIPAFDLNWAGRGAIAGLNGFLFGVTYRYVVRRDTNPQLKAGTALAFGLVRASAQLEVGLSEGISIFPPQHLWPFVVMGVESVAMFATATLILDCAYQCGWIQPFNSN